MNYSDDYISKLAVGPGQQPKPDVFNSKQEMVAAMADPRYRTDAAYSQAVIEKVTRTAQAQQPDRPYINTEAQHGDVGMHFRSEYQITEAIKDPRYRKDPAYREAVQAALLRTKNENTLVHN